MRFGLSVSDSLSDDELSMTESGSLSFSTRISDSPGVEPDLGEDLDTSRLKLPPDCAIAALDKRLYALSNEGKPVGGGEEVAVLSPIGFGAGELDRR